MGGRYIHAGSLINAPLVGMYRYMGGFGRDAFRGHWDVNLSRALLFLEHV